MSSRWPTAGATNIHGSLRLFGTFKLVGSTYQYLEKDGTNYIFAMGDSDHLGANRCSAWPIATAIRSC